MILAGAVDWSATGTMLQGIGTLSGALAVFGAAWIGANTFGSWKRQQFASRRAKEAEEILTAAYNARRALNQIRSPCMSGHELEAAELVLKENDWWDGEPEQRKRRLKTAQGYFNRFNFHKDKTERLDNCLALARALFGEDLENSIETLRHQFWMVQVDVESYIDDDGSDKDFTNSIRMGMYKVKDGENKVTKTVEESISTIEFICLPVLRLE